MKYLKFKVNIYDGELIVWKKGEEFNLMAENEKAYFCYSSTNLSVLNGIDKSLEGKYFDIVYRRN